MTEPTDAELGKLAEECGIGWAAGLGGMSDFLSAFARAVLAKWGTPQPVLRIKGNKCERCGWAEARCDVHHITPRAEGGKNFVSNGVVLCPNCHRVAHEQSGGGEA